MVKVIPSRPADLEWVIRGEIEREGGGETLEGGGETLEGGDDTLGVGEEALGGGEEALVDVGVAVAEQPQMEIPPRVWRRA